ncbi:MAG: formylglycine-generating enzyme family protein [Ideonella sp.]|jgi:formylglycine-generating enzyme required for sulfatase activity|nr:formylglycine-generating enzyme family protein [Ideonella sp.]
MFLALAGGMPTAAVADTRPNPAGVDWVRVEPAGQTPFSIARTETTVGQFRRFAAATAMRTAAEQAGGGEVYEAGWVRKPGWTWSTPFGTGRPAGDDEPAVHLSFDEAQAFCRWAGGRLPRDSEWATAAYTEWRAQPPAPFARGRTYPYPTGESPMGAQCLGDCGPEAERRALRHGASLLRGHGHALAGSTPAGVNGLHEMGANAWEWVDDPPGATAREVERRTRGGSWWYGAGPMRADHRQAKPPGTTVVYIGFRCARDEPAR